MSRGSEAIELSWSDIVYPTLPPNLYGAFIQDCQNRKFSPAGISATLVMMEGRLLTSLLAGKDPRSIKPDLNILDRIITLRTANIADGFRVELGRSPNSNSLLNELFETVTEKRPEMLFYLMAVGPLFGYIEPANRITEVEVSLLGNAPMTAERARLEASLIERGPVSFVNHEASRLMRSVANDAAVIPELRPAYIRHIKGIARGRDRFNQFYNFLTNPEVSGLPRL